MENYTWTHNKAVVDRMYYTERVLLVTSLAAGFFTATNLFYIKKNYFAETARARLFPTFKYWAIINLVTAAVLLRPLTAVEMQVQWKRRVSMGKYLYTLQHLDYPEEKAEEASH